MNADAGQPLLAVKDLDVRFRRGRRETRVLRGLEFEIRPSEIHAFVGESGSGKTVTARAVMNILPSPPAVIAGGSIRFGNEELTTLPPEAYRKLRGKKIAMIFQEPARYLNPSMRIGRQIGETLEHHEGLSKKDSPGEVRKLLERVGLDADSARSYPHELSGGMKQRAMIAMAVSCKPDLLIADEPTTALDVTLQVQILELIGSLRDEYAMSVLFISHDLMLTATLADRISVFYAGTIVETGESGELFESPLHPYTALLIAAVPGPSTRGKALRTIPGRVPDADHVPEACPFHTRCPRAERICGETMPAFRDYGNGRRAACHFAGEYGPVTGDAE